MTVKLLTEHHLEFVRLKGGCTGSSESTHVKMSNCWKSHALAQIKFNVWKYVSTLTHIKAYRRLKLTTVTKTVILKEQTVRHKLTFNVVVCRVFL